MLEHSEFRFRVCLCHLLRNIIFQLNIVVVTFYVKEMNRLTLNHTNCFSNDRINEIVIPL